MIAQFRLRRYNWKETTSKSIEWYSFRCTGFAIRFIVSNCSCDGNWCTCWIDTTLSGLAASIRENWIQLIKMYLKMRYLILSIERLWGNYPAHIPGSNFVWLWVMKKTEKSQTHEFYGKSGARFSFIGVYSGTFFCNCNVEIQVWLVLS